MSGASFGRRRGRRLGVAADNLLGDALLEGAHPVKHHGAGPAVGVHVEVAQPLQLEPAPRNHAQPRHQRLEAAYVLSR